MSLQHFDPDRAIANEDAILRRLCNANPHGSPLFLRGLRELAFKEARLGYRYCLACSYAWASGDSWDRQTEMMEKATLALARDMGLHCYLQTDPRGRTVYVAQEPLTSQSYSSQGVAIFYPSED